MLPYRVLQAKDTIESDFLPFGNPKSESALEQFGLSWQKERLAKGIYHHIGVGMRRDLAGASSSAAHRLRFAGEHLAQQASGMEGALESGGRAATLTAERG
jgi:monoamine oxidase